MVDAIMQFPAGEKIHLLAPVIRGRKGEYKKELRNIRQKGFIRVRIDESIIDLSQTEELPTLEKNKKHDIEVVIDRLIVKEGLERRLADSLELAAKMGDGIVYVLKGEERLLFLEHLACINCGVSYPKIEPRLFSFNSPHGACDGLGTTLDVDPDLVVPNKNLSLRDGAIKPWARRGSVFYDQIMEALSDHYGIDHLAPFRKIAAKHRQALLYGSGRELVEFTGMRDGELITYRRRFEGVIPNLERRYKETNSSYIRQEIEIYMAKHPCPTCEGRRLKTESLAIKVAGQSIAEVTHHSIKDALAFVDGLTLSERETLIGERILKESSGTLGFSRQCRRGLLFRYPLPPMT